MKILALDTSTDYCSVALAIDADLAVRETRAGQNHSSLLLRMIDEVLRERAVALKDLDAIAYGEGPGSFTGLRIACGVVQGLAFGSGVPVVGVGTLLAMAAGTASDRVVCCVDARIHEIYHAAYCRVHAGERTEVPAAPLRGGERTEGNQRFPSETSLPSVYDCWEVVHAPAIYAPAEAPALPGDGWHGCGSGFAVYRDVLEARYAGQLSAVEPDRHPHAREIAALAQPFVARGEVSAAETAAPVYLRDKVALRIDERPNR